MPMPPMQLRFRPLTAKDQDLVWQLLQFAAHEESVRAVKSVACCIPYADQFGTRRGDFGVLAYYCSDDSSAVQNTNNKQQQQQLVNSSQKSNNDNESDGDDGTTTTAIPIGGAWIRQLGPNGMAASSDPNSIKNNNDDDDDSVVPELAMAVFPAHRNQGIGSQLLQEFLRALHVKGKLQAGDDDDDAKQQPRMTIICLSCRIDNVAAMRLYKRHGFQVVPNSQMTNRAGGTSISMMLKNCDKQSQACTIVEMQHG